MVGDCTGAGGADEGTARLEVLLQVDEVWEPLAEDWRGAKAGRGGVGRGDVDMVNVCVCMGVDVDVDVDGGLARGRAGF